MSINTKLIHFKNTLLNNRHASKTKTLATYILNKYLELKFHHENAWTTSPMSRLQPKRLNHQIISRLILDLIHKYID